MARDVVSTMNRLLAEWESPRVPEHLAQNGTAWRIASHHSSMRIADSMARSSGSHNSAHRITVSILAIELRIYTSPPIAAPPRQARADSRFSE